MKSDLSPLNPSRPITTCLALPCRHGCRLLTVVRLGACLALSCQYGCPFFGVSEQFEKRRYRESTYKRRLDQRIHRSSTISPHIREEMVNHKKSVGVYDSSMFQILRWSV
jgi:hypothetical protein